MAAREFCLRYPLAGIFFVRRGDIVAHSLSANKRIRQTAKRRERNRDRKKVLKFTIKKFDSVLAGGNKETTAVELKAAIKKIDKTAAKGTIHKNTAARRKSALARKLNALAVKA
jgi:small subunit ribosomal protein S20